MAIKVSTVGGRIWLRSAGRTDLLLGLPQGLSGVLALGQPPSGGVVLQSPTLPQGHGLMSNREEREESQASFSAYNLSSAQPELCPNAVIDHCGTGYTQQEMRSLSPQGNPGGRV